MILKTIKTLFIVLFSFNLFAFQAVEFENDEQQQRFQTLINELRCLVCQNQNIADSNAELAIDLKKIIKDKILVGETNEQIKDFMIARYGDFVLYKPPFQKNTLLLWLAPLLFIILGLLAFFVHVVKFKKQRITINDEDLNQTKQRLKALD